MGRTSALDAALAWRFHQPAVFASMSVVGTLAGPVGRLGFFFGSGCLCVTCICRCPILCFVLVCLFDLVGLLWWCFVMNGRCPFWFMVISLRGESLLLYFGFVLAAVLVPFANVAKRDGSSNITENTLS